MMRWIRAVIAAAAAWVFVPAASAQDVPDKLAECKLLGSEAARLACYDRLAETVVGEKSAGAGAAAEPTTATDTSAPAASSPEPAASSNDDAASKPGEEAAGPARSDDFGYRGGALARGDSKKAQEKASTQPEPSVVALVTEISDRQGLLVITLDNGQVWKQKSSQNFRLKTGDPVKIEPGVLGSYMLTGPYSKRATRVTRVR